MTVDACAGLLRNLLAFGERLILQHIRVTAFFPEVFRKRITGPHDFQPRIFFESRFNQPLNWSCMT